MRDDELPYRLELPGARLSAVVFWAAENAHSVYDVLLCNGVVVCRFADQTDQLLATVRFR
jgi:hypothetical protein